LNLFGGSTIPMLVLLDINECGRPRRIWNFSLRLQKTLSPSNREMTAVGTAEEIAR